MNISTETREILRNYKAVINARRREMGQKPLTTAQIVALETADFAGMKTGQVVGQSARKNDIPASDPVSTGNLMSTIMHTLFDPTQLRLDPSLSTDVINVIQSSEPIGPLMPS